MNKNELKEISKDFTNKVVFGLIILAILIIGTIIVEEATEINNCLPKELNIN